MNTTEYARFRPAAAALIGPYGRNEGKFAVMMYQGGPADGPFETYEAALEFGYATYGTWPFLVGRIERAPTVTRFTRDV